MKYQNLEFTPGIKSNYSFDIRTDAGVARDLSPYSLKLEVFDKSGTKIFTNTTPNSIIGSVVTFSVLDTGGNLLSVGNYQYRVVGTELVGGTIIPFVKGFITVLEPEEYNEISGPTPVLDRTEVIQGALDMITEQPFPDEYRYGKGGAYKSSGGISKVRPLTMSTWAGIYGQGPQGSTIWRMSHGVPYGTDVSMITVLDDADAAAGIGSKAYIENMAFDGDSRNAVDRETCLTIPSLLGDKDDAPVLKEVLITNFSGDGVNVGEYHNQFRSDSLKTIANKGWGLKMNRISDSKNLRLGSGRNLQGQVYLENCASPKFVEFDIWTPGSGTFEGIWAIQMVKCRNVQFSYGELQGRLRIEGGNCSDSDKTRFQDVGTVFSNFDFKVSPNTYYGKSYVAGGGTNVYSSIISIMGCDAVKFSDGIIGYSLGDPDSDELLATPDYVFEFSVLPGRDYESEAGWTELKNVGMAHKRYVAGQQLVQVPYKKKPSSDMARMIRREMGPGDIVIRSNTAVKKNMLKCDGSTYVPRNYPLMWSELNFSNSLDTAPGTASLPNIPDPSPGFSYYIIAW